MASRLFAGSDENLAIHKVSNSMIIANKQHDLIIVNSWHMHVQKVWPALYLCSFRFWAGQQFDPKQSHCSD